MPGRNLPRDPHGFDTIDRAILSGIAAGGTNPEIADALKYSTFTVQSRIVRAMRILNARNRAHLAALYVRTYELRHRQATHA
jgi:DNA-binding NarL/FixJ family response regulator